MKFSSSLLTVLAVACTYGHATRLPAGHRIFGGKEVDISQHPHQLTLHRSGSYKCGASIIGRQWAITAAQCIDDHPLECNWLGSGSNDRESGTFYKVSQMIKHPDYEKRFEHDYDIGLLKIEGEFEYGDNVQPIILAERELQAGENVNVTGWGATLEGHGVIDELMGVTVPIVDHKLCEDVYVNSYFKANITSRMICAGLYNTVGNNVCIGDYGGPLSANNTLYGIVSFGYGCGKPNYLGVYTNVAELRSWITSVTGI